MKIAGLYFQEDTVQVSIADVRFSSSKKLHDEQVSLVEEYADRETVLCGHLARWKKEDGISGVVFGLGFRQFSYNFMELPVEDDADIRRALDFELEKHLPLSPEQYYHDFHVLKKDATGTKCLVLSIRKERLAWILRCVERTGLRLMGIKCTCIEAVNEVAGRGRDMNATILSSDGDRYTAFGLKSSNLSRVSVVNKAGGAAVKIGEQCLDNGEEMFLWAPGEGHGDAPEGVCVLRTGAHDLLSLSTGRKCLVDMDFAPGERMAVRKDRVSIALAGMALVSIVLLFLSLGISYYKDASSLQRTEEQLASLHGTATKALETRQEIESLQKRRDYLLTFQKDRDRDIKALERLSTILPDGTWLTDFHVRTDGRVEIEGYSRRSAKLSGLLEKTGEFRNVSYTAPVTIKDGRERFSVRMDMGG
jgi:hypothetical protein